MSPEIPSRLQNDYDPSWRRTASPPTGGTVIDLAAGPEGELWAASPAGLFHRSESGGWRPQITGLPLVRAHTLAASGNTLLAAGAPGGLARSPDRGRSWQQAWIEQTREPVTCLVVAPTFSSSGVALAGTDGAGILRTTDGGRYWQLANFGLRTFHILSLAVPPMWSRHEPVFAGTSGGLYESPNGGRAWRLVQGVPADAAVLSLAVEPNFAITGLVLAGTEAHGLFRSTDGGRNWASLDEPFGGGAGAGGPVNSLGFTSSGALLASGGAAGIWRSEDGGQTWELVGNPPGPVLVFRMQEGKVFAGLAQGGLWQSSDDGLNWEPENRLAARRFLWLAPAPEGGWLAGGPLEGLWHQTPGEGSWTQLPISFQEEALLCLAAGDGHLLVGTNQNLWRAEAAMGPWQRVLRLDAPPTTLAVAGEAAWAGDQHGNLWSSVDRGRTWTRQATPFAGQALLELAAAPDFAESRTLLAVTTEPARRALRLWRSPDGGARWELWVDERTDWFGPHLIPAGAGGETTTLAWGLTCLTHSSSGWQRVEITDRSAPLTAAVGLPSDEARLVAAGNQFFWSKDGGSWRKQALAWEGGCTALAATSDCIFALSHDGGLYSSDYTADRS